MVSIFGFSPIVGNTFADKICMIVSSNAGQAVSVRILVAGDNKVTQDVVGSFLELLGFGVVLACNGIDPLTVFIESSFDLVLTGPEMPAMDGWGITRCIKQRSFEINHSRIRRSIMFRKAVAIGILIVFFSFVLVSCASEQYQQNRGAIIGGGTGAAAGGAVGGVIGAQSGHTGAGVAIGSLLGALAGAGIGHYAYDQKRTETEAQEQYAYDYDQSKATLVRIDDVFASPATVRLGGTVDLSTTYTVLGPQGATMEVIETREIRHGDELVGKPQVTVQRQGGTYTSRVPLMLPGGGQRGVYNVHATIQSGGSSDSREFSFTVY